MSAIIRTRVVARGRVQGVFFRDSCRRAANAAGVAGWVRNRHDGAVEAVFEGTEVQVATMLDWCRTGPPTAQVLHLESHDERVEGLTSFEIRR
ncbi:acylphosphatase [Actinopolymorpha sp. B9G3]|uniref:acylphosphatase n=1 Tax=unclassified Actinopolymorpha TaxID=2627063 RepID=UPI0032D93C48